MKNYLTKREYSGQNVDTLFEAGYSESDQFVTFKQALKLEGVSGANLKGLKKAATLFFYKKEIDKETEKEKIVRKYFTVFNIKDVFATVELNQKTVA
jgi:antirestriction protein ArdC